MEHVMVPSQQRDPRPYDDHAQGFERYPVRSDVADSIEPHVFERLACLQVCHDAKRQCHTRDTEESEESAADPEFVEKFRCDKLEVRKNTQDEYADEACNPIASDLPAIAEKADAGKDQGDRYGSLHRAPGKGYLRNELFHCTKNFGSN